MNDAFSDLFDLTDDRQDLLELLLQEEDITLAAAKTAVIPLREVTSPAPLSAAQQRIWFLEQLTAGNYAYHIPAAVRLEGPLSVAALASAINEVIVRHESLRTTFTAVSGQPEQHIQPEMRVPLPVEQLPEGSDDTAVRRRISELVQKPFDLTTGPLLRTHLLQLDANTHIWVLVVHHLVFDGWSSDIFFREVAAFYSAAVNNQAVDLSSSPIQYADFAVWQQTKLNAAQKDADLQFWEETLGGELPPLQLPYDRPRPVGTSIRGAVLRHELDAGLAAALRRLSQQEGATLFMTLLAGFQTLLARYSGQADIAVGTPVTNRPAPELDNLIGMFVNTIVLRAAIDGNATFRSLLRDVRQNALAAYEHQTLPFEDVVAHLQPERESGQNPLFQVMFALENRTGAGGVDFANVSAAAYPIETGAAQFDLTLDIAEKTDGLVCYFEYNADLFSETTIERLATHYERLLAAIAANADLRLGQIDFLTETETHQLLHVWSGSDTAVTADCVPTWFSRQAQERGNETAVILSDGVLSYGVLERRANQLAHHLQSLGVGPDTIVGLHLARGESLIVALLGVLKAGGAYLPLDPTYPAARLRYMVADARAALILTASNAAKDIQAEGATVVALDDPATRAAITQAAATPPPTAVTPDNLAYVIYTSGSTGQPKGVMVPHRALAAHNHAVQTEYALHSSDRVLQFASTSFDVAAEEIFPTWLSGGAVVLRREAQVENFSQFRALIVEHEISVLNLPAAYWQAWTKELAASGETAPASLRLVVTGSERVLAQDLAQWQAVVGNHVRWLNAYGPTEATITSSLYEPRPGQPITGPSVPIGRPLPGWRVYVVDACLNPVPAGVPGELLIGGAGLARGYLGRPRQTAEKFIPDPFSGKAGSRLYRTGDRVRFLPNGDLEFLERVDEQVKIRGFRIELGEVESVLARYPGVTVSAAAVKENGHGDAKLVGYYVPNAHVPQISALRAYMAQKLPEYMVPAAFMAVDKLPLTPSGKINRKALPGPAETAVETSTEHVPPADAVEARLVQIWEEVLGVKPIGIDDDYFKLGGHSLQAVRLVASIEKAFGQNLPVAILFQYPTVAQLADVIRNADNTPKWSSLIPIQPAGHRPPFFCVHGGAGHVFHYRELARRLGPDQPFYGIQPEGWDQFRVDALPVEELAARYVDAIRAFQPAGPYYLGGFCFGGMIAFEMAQQLKAAGEEVAVLALIEPSSLVLQPAFQNTGNESLADRAMRHRHNIQQLSWPEKVPYLGSTARRRLQTVTKQITGWLQEIQFHVQKKIFQYYYLASNRPIPGKLRDFYLMEFVAADAQEIYLPAPYRGNFHLFLAKHHLSHEECCDGWEHVAGSDMKVYRVNSTHLDILRSPHVQLVADPLRRAISEAVAEVE